MRTTTNEKARVHPASPAHRGRTGDRALRHQHRLSRQYGNGAKVPQGHSARTDAEIWASLQTGGALFFPRCDFITIMANEAAMNIQLPLRMDKPAFLAWLDGRQERYELVEGRVVMMTRPTRAHGIIVLNLATIIRSQLDPRK